MGYSDVLRGRRPTRPPPGFHPSIGSNSEYDLVIDRDGRRYHCRAIDSPRHEWRIAYGAVEGASESRIFVYHGSELVFTNEADRPMAADIGDTGWAIILEGGAFDQLNGRARTFSPSGDLVATQEFAVNPRDCAIATDGRFAATLTMAPEARIDLLDVRQATVRGTYDVDDISVRLMGFTSGPDHLLYVAQDEREDPFFALDVDGTLAWRSDKYRDTEAFSKRVRGFLRPLWPFNP